MLCPSLLYSQVTQLYTSKHSFFYILFHYGLSLGVEYSSLYYIVGPCCLSLLNVIVCIYQLQTPSPSLPQPPPPWQPQVCSLCLCRLNFLFETLGKLRFSTWLNYLGTSLSSLWLSWKLMDSGEKSKTPSHPIIPQKNYFWKRNISLSIRSLFI